MDSKTNVDLQQIANAMKAAAQANQDHPKHPLWVADAAPVTYEWVSWDDPDVPTGRRICEREWPAGVQQEAQWREVKRR